MLALQVQADGIGFLRRDGLEDEGSVALPAFGGIVVERVTAGWVETSGSKVPKA